MRRIIVVVDRESAADPGFDRACAIAEEHRADLGIVRLQPAVTFGQHCDHPADLMAIIADTRAHHPGIGAIAIGSVARSGEAIVTAATTAGADLIVMGNSIDEALPNAAPFALIDKVVHCTALPVLAVQNAALAPYRRIVALVDQGAVAHQALDLALSQKSAREIYALHACDGGAREEDIASFVRLVAAAGQPARAVEIRPIVRTEDISTALIKSWREFQPDLVVAVRRRRRGLRGLLASSNVRELLEDAPFDLLIQKATPVREEMIARRQVLESLHPRLTVGSTTIN